MAQDDLSNKSIRLLIQEAKGETRAEIKKEVWGALTPKTQERLGNAELGRLIATELTDPLQFEFTIGGEPYPLADVPTELLLRRGLRLVASGKNSIIRGQAYIATAKARGDISKGDAK